MQIEQEKKKLPFVTLRQFSEVLAQTVVTDGQKNVLSLEDGLERVVHLFEQIKRQKKKSLIIGNGGSEAIASHMSTDLNKNAGIRSLAFTDPSLLTCLSNDYGYDEVYAKSIEYHLEQDDLLIAISSSGKSQNILKGVHRARKMFGQVVTFSGFGAENPLFELGDYNFYVPSPRYGIVEVGHLLLLHAIIDETIERSMLWS